MAEPAAAQPTFRRITWIWLPVLLYVGVIFTLSAQPRLQPPLGLRLSDKVYHVVEYWGLGVLLSRAFGNRARAPFRLAALSMIVGVLVGTADELFQSTVPGRHCSAVDLVADSIGVVLGQLAYRLYLHRLG